MSELKPCPFCGGEAAVSERHEAQCYEPNVYYEGFEVVCDKCDGLVIVYDEGNQDRASKDKVRTDAIAAWNTRYHSTNIKR